MDISVRAGVHGLHQLDLFGHCHDPHWVAGLFSGLADHGVSIISGHAAQDGQGLWRAQFELDFRDCASDPQQLDYALMMRRAAALDAAMPALSSFGLSRRPDRGLELNLRAPDQRGFLGRLLVRISGLALFPVEMEIRTVGGQIDDRLVFRGIGGAVPGEAIPKALESLLKRMLRPGQVAAA